MISKRRRASIDHIDQELNYYRHLFERLKFTHEFSIDAVPDDDTLQRRKDEEEA
jgi:hypothetical protein